MSQPYRRVASVTCGNRQTSYGIFALSRAGLHGASGGRGAVGMNGLSPERGPVSRPVSQCHRKRTGRAMQGNSRGLTAETQRSRRRAPVGVKVKVKVKGA